MKTTLKQPDERSMNTIVSGINWSELQMESMRFMLETRRNILHKIFQQIEHGSEKRESTNSDNTIRSNVE